MEKIIRDGMVAVAVSGGFGAGWSTWNDIDPMDARFNQLFLDGKRQEAEDLCDELDLGYAGGVRDVEIEWVPVGTKFVISEYDGAESLETIDDFNWKVA
jgi:hypothetical protein